jgi:hypothetical protein
LVHAQSGVSPGLGSVLVEAVLVWLVLGLAPALPAMRKQVTRKVSTNTITMKMA